MAQSGIKPHQEPDELLPFERLLTEISTLFINLPADQIDNEIKAAQRRICELLDIDRSTLWITSQDDPGTLLLTHIHQPPGIPSPPERMSTKDFFPWTAQKVLGGETLAISKMTELPAEADRDRENYRLYGTKSGVVDSVISRKRASIWFVGLRRYTGGKRLAEEGRATVSAGRADIRQCARPEARGSGPLRKRVQAPRTIGGNQAAEASIRAGEHLSPG